MTSSTRTCSLLTEFLSTMNPQAPPGSRGRGMMLRKLRLYLWWKRQLKDQKQGASGTSMMPNSSRGAMDGFDRLFAVEDGLSEALKKKDREKAARAQSRRRMRGGAPTAGHPVPKPEPMEPNLNVLQNEADIFSQLYVAFCSFVSFVY